ncbi:2-C-methyl-D-erythritol 4-phosphate cytidylyltransferase [Rubrolithibacter danxiaensis]|uniref:2-C-methyl-D-erythritol 4-phosphate cytidylyltransferase n=1 Tax=Rubrolithibacter danxiaensis TaxID=3390805 RepID=UPI003BF87759
MKYYALIVAGGNGSRMSSDVPKQFLLLKGKPVLMHTVEAFYQSDIKPEIIIVLNRLYTDQWKSFCEEYNFNIPHKVVAGGENRFYSVKNGLNEISENAVVAVHDAVRPLIDIALITKSYIVAQEKGNAVCCISSRDSIRQKQGNSSIALKRESIFIVQTPQTFQAKLLKEAYNQPYTDEFTDDASVAEKAGVAINLIEGNRQNIKITYQEDLLIAEVLLNRKSGI